MATRINIQDFDQKLQLALGSELSSIRSEKDLINFLQVQSDYFYRIKRGTRPLNNELFHKICMGTSIEPDTWKSGLEEFGRQLGYTRRQLSEVAKVTLPGIDFISRNKDPVHLRNLHDLLHGYWESYYYSVSKSDEKVVSRDLCIIGDLNDDNFIECQIVDGWFDYTGWCFPISHHLYFALEKEKLLNEVIFYCTNKPDRFPPKLFGIIQCVSGGVDDIIPYPSASRVSFRFLGRTAQQVIAETNDTYGPKIEKLISDGIALDEAMRKLVPGYVYPDSDMAEKEKPFVDAIDNRIEIDSVPYALRMKE